VRYSLRIEPSTDADVFFATVYEVEGDGVEWELCAFRLDRMTRSELREVAVLCAAGSKDAILKMWHEF
jgi:hypothetical protein